MIDMIFEQDDAVSTADLTQCCSRRSIAWACQASGVLLVGLPEQSSADVAWLVLVETTALWRRTMQQVHARSTAVVSSTNREYQRITAYDAVTMYQCM